MDVTFLGTGAAEGYPNPFCACDHCRRARELGGRSLRTRSAALVGNDLLIDLGPDLIAAAALHGRPLAHVRYCLQTHAHADHLDASLLLARSPEYGVSNARRLHLSPRPPRWRASVSSWRRIWHPARCSTRSPERGSTWRSGRSSRWSASRPARTG